MALFLKALVLMKFSDNICSSELGSNGISSNGFGSENIRRDGTSFSDINS
jgi:hypothetical protein